VSTGATDRPRWWYSRGMRRDVAERRTDRLLLRRMRAADLRDLHRMHRDPRVMATLGGVRPAAATVRLVRRVQRSWTRHGFGLWTVRDPDTGVFLGRGGLLGTRVGGGDDVEVAYAFVPECWGRGLATELARESVRVAFDVLELPDVVCFTTPTNAASLRVMEKLGFRAERDVVVRGLPHVFCRLRR